MMGSDQELMLGLRRALLMANRAIERRYNLTPIEHETCVGRASRIDLTASDARAAVLLVSRLFGFVPD